MTATSPFSCQLSTDSTLPLVRRTRSALARDGKARASAKIRAKGKGQKEKVWNELTPANKFEYLMTSVRPFLTFDFCPVTFDLFMSLTLARQTRGRRGFPVPGCPCRPPAALT